MRLSFRRIPIKLKILTGFLLFLLSSFNVLAQDAQEKPKGTQRKFALVNVFSDVVEVTKISGYDSDNWLDDFEIEIKNITDKPIYYLWIMIDVLDSDREDRDVNHNDVMKVEMDFGDRDLFPTGARPKDLEKDPHLNPAEKVTMKISEKEKEGYKIILARRLQDASVSTDQVAKVILHVMRIKYGDGTVENPITRKKG